jgi:putative peptide zinc metalloprotease protein
MSEVELPRPRRVEQVQTRCEQTPTGGLYYVLHNPVAGAYVELDAENHFLWELMDGEHTVADLAMAYFGRFGAFPFERLDQLLSQLAASQLLADTAPVAAPSPGGRLADRLQRLAATAFQREFVFEHADLFFDKFYRRGGWVFFTRPALLACAMVAVAGFGCFLVLEPMEEYALLSANGSHGIGLVALWVALLAVIFCHECGHGLTCKANGRAVRRAGFMFYLGMPAFFVDASDMWLAGRRARIAVSAAGPIVNCVLGGGLAIVVLLLPVSLPAQVLHQVAWVAFLGVLLNLNPLLNLDGYYVLMDWLDMPQLRERSFAFVRRDLLTRLRTRARFTREETIYSWYGVLASVCTGAMVLLALYIWENELKLLMNEILAGQDWLAVALLGGLTLAAGTSLALGLAARAVLLADAAWRKWCAQKKQAAPH